MHDQQRNYYSDTYPAPMKITNGSTAPTIGTAGDGISAQPGLYTNSLMVAMNVAGLIERWRNNTQGTLLASGARTATTVSPVQTNHNAKGIIVFLNITLASGTGGLQVDIRGRDPVSNNPADLIPIPTAITAAGLYLYELFPGSSTAGVAGANKVQQRTQGVLPRSFDVAVLHGDASSYTYSLGYALSL
jgi:hypothetical protein